MLSARRLERNHERGLGQLARIELGYLGSRRVPGVEITELDSKNRSLQFVHAVVETDLFMAIFFDLCVIAQGAEPGGKFFIIRCYRARFPEGAEILGRIKAETSEIAIAPGAKPFVFRSVSLSCVFNQCQSMLRTKLTHGFQVGHLTIKMHRKYRPGLRANDARNLLDVQIARAQVDINKYRSCAYVRDCP